MANTYIGPRKHDGVDCWKPSWCMTMIHTSFTVNTTATYDQGPLSLTWVQFNPSMDK